MALFFRLWQHRGLCAVAERLRAGEHLFAFLNDVHVASSPERSVDARLILEEEMWRHAKIRLHFGNTVIWNKSGLAPEGVEALEEAARRVDQTAVVWRGNPDLSTERKGVVVLGTPVGHPEFVSCPRAEDAGTQHPLAEDSSRAGPTFCLGLVVVLRRSKGPCLVEDDKPRTHGGVWITTEGFGGASATPPC